MADNINTTNTAGTNVDPATGLPLTGSGSATELAAAYGVSTPATVTVPNANADATATDNTPKAQPVVTTGIGNMNSASLAPNDANSATSIPSGASTVPTEQQVYTEAQQLELAAQSSTPVSNPTGKSGQVLTSQSNGAVSPDSDWRVKLQLATGAKYLYKADTVKNATDDILHPLSVTDGVIFPYMPTIQVGYKASYDTQELIHSNYKLHFYKNSSVDEVQITADFTAQDIVEAKYMLAVIHFFRSVTKMFYGQDTNPVAGTPPPLCFLSGLGQYQFNHHPLLITSFNYSLPNDVDYIRTEVGAAWKGYTIPTATSKKSSLKQSILQRLSNSNLNAGAGGSTPNFASLNNNSLIHPTYVPTKIQMTFTALPVVTRKDISKNFSVKDYATGSLLKKGIW